MIAQVLADIKPNRERVGAIEVDKLFRQAVQNLTFDAVRRAERCGCRGCKADAAAAAEWARRTLGDW